MNVHELPMILFTVIGQMSVGAFWVLGAIHVYGYGKKMSPESVDRLTNTGLYAAGPLLVLGFVAAFFHLGDPVNALNTLRHVGSSWQSREIASGILFGVSGFVFAVSQWCGWFSRGVRQVFAGVTAVAGLLLVVTMAGTYYSVETIPAWHHVGTWVFFFGSAVLTGSLAVGVALLVWWNLQARHDVSGGRGWAVRLRLVSDEPLTGELTGLTTKALAGISLAAALAGVALLVAYPVYVLDLVNGSEASGVVAGRLMGPVSLVRWVLLGVVVVLAGVVAFVRARVADRPSRVLVWVIVSAFVVAVVSELLGRAMHYEGLYHVGLNTTQYLLGH